MKKILFMIMTVLGWINLTSCNDYLDIVPKGNKIPTTLADFEALLRDEYTIGYIPVTNSLYLLNDKFVGQSSLTSVTLTSANYLWNETADRIVLNNQDEGTYYRSYMAISTCNLLLEHVPVATEATDSERNEVMAYAKVIMIMTVLGWINLTSCNDYLDIVPKGNKIPTTLADFEALLRDEYTIGYIPVTNSLYLLNDKFVGQSSLTSVTLTSANYLWNETADRIVLNNQDEGTYYRSYMAISTCNLLLEHVPVATEATDSERNEVMAYAKVIRAMSYYILANYYADTYVSATAGTKLSVPLITSADINAPHKQVTIQEIYDFMIKDVKEAIEQGLPEQSRTVIHPNLGAAYAFLARVYLQMANYEEALKYADMALEQNDNLYDWISYYDTHKEAITKEDSYPSLPSVTGYDYVENYYFRCGEGNPNYATSELNIPVERAESFEEGDARFFSRWKLRTVNQDTYYQGLAKGYFNGAGLTTCEVYLIKAECLARQVTGNDFSAAMDVLNKVRKTRILPEIYQPLQASTLTEAIDLIRRTKDNELIFTIVPFADARRFNAEGTFARALSKTWEGQTYTLTPASHLWIMPFPAGAVQNPGNGTITQNVSK